MEKMKLMLILKTVHVVLVQLQFSIGIFSRCLVVMVIAIGSSNMSDKFAVQLFGHLRTFRACYPYLKKNLLDLGDFDIFIHTWDEVERKTPSHVESKITPKLVTEEIKKEVTELYNPKKIEFTSQIDFYDDEVEVAGNRFNLNGIRNMYFSMSAVTKLRKKFQEESGSQYSLVVMTRPDALLREQFPLDMILERTKAKRFRKCIFSAPYLRRGAMRAKKLRIFDEKAPGSDVLFMGKAEDMDCFSDIADTDDFYFFDDYLYNEGKGEPIFSNYLIENNLTLKFITYFGPKNWKIQREEVYKAGKNYFLDFKDELYQSRKHFAMSARMLFKSLR